MSDWKPDREEAEFIGRCMAIDHGIAEIVTDQLRRGVPLRNVRATLEDALRITRMVRGQTTPPEGAREERVMEKGQGEMFDKPAKPPRYRLETVFVRNAYGLWCPNCEERIDELWPVSCDCCGYPKRDYDRFEDDPID